MPLNMQIGEHYCSEEVITHQSVELGVAFLDQASNNSLRIHCLKNLLPEQTDPILCLAKYRTNSIKEAEKLSRIMAGC